MLCWSLRADTVKNDSMSLQILSDFKLVPMTFVSMMLPMNLVLEGRDENDNMLFVVVL